MNPENTYLPQLKYWMEKEVTAETEYKRCHNNVLIFLQLVLQEEVCYEPQPDA